MTIAVLGGAGYIGSHTVKFLHQSGVPIVVFDNLSKGHADAVSGVPLIKGDIGDRDALEACFKGYRVQSVINFAALSTVAESNQRPALYYRNNLVNTQLLLDCMMRCEIHELIFSSTCAIYGIPIEIPLTEDHPYAPINTYGRTKLAVEYMLQDYSKAYGLNYISLRYFNAAGADFEAQIGERHEPETHLIPLVLDAALGRRKHVNLYGTDYATPDGTCIRDYIHVWDLAQAHWLALQYLREYNQSDVFNLGNGKGYSVREIIDGVEKVTGKKIKVQEADRRLGDPPILIGSSTKAHKKLHWSPEVQSLESIISSAWKWHQKWHLKSPKNIP